MSDRELLELAAKGAGHHIAWWEGATPYFRPDDLPSGIPWRPLTDDGDALALLCFVLKWDNLNYYDSDTLAAAILTVKVALVRGDVKAVREATVCAAAEIGRAMS
jgi:hypothetical protein